MSLRTYVNESYKELTNKVTWPAWKDLQASAIVVLIASIIIALIVFVMDWIFGINNVADGTTNIIRLWRGLLGWLYDFIS